jgi:hypothetical protein
MSMIRRALTLKAKALPWVLGKQEKAMTRDDLRKGVIACVPVHEVRSYTRAVLTIDFRHFMS